MLASVFRLYRNSFEGLAPEVWLLSLVVLINRSGTMVIPFLSIYLTSMGFSLPQTGYVMAAFGTGCIVGAYLGGKLTDLFGHFYVQAFSLFLNGLFFIILGQMHTLLQFCLCIFVLSTLGESFRPANYSAIAAYSNESNRARSYALNRLAVNIGWAIGPAIGGLLAGVSYQLLFLIDGMTCVAASLALCFFLSAERNIASRKLQDLSVRPARVNSPYRDKIFLVGMIYLFLAGLCYFQVSNILTVYFRRELHLTETVIGAVLALNGLIIAFFEMVLVYKLENRKSDLLYMMGGSFLIGCSFLVLNISPAAVWVWLQVIIVTLGEMLLFCFVNNFWVKRSKDFNRGQYASVYTMTFSASIVLAPTFGSQIAAFFGFSTLWAVNFMLCSISALGYYFLNKRRPLLIKTNFL